MQRYGGHQQPARVLFTYWGRRGPLSLFALQIGRAMASDARVRVEISVSRQNESYAHFAELGSALFPVDTFTSDAGAILRLWSVPRLRARLARHIEAAGIAAVIELMPHIWSPLVMSVVQRTGARYCTIIHDADPHAGDRSSPVNKLLELTLGSADLVLTLSSSVAGRLAATGRVTQAKLFTLFHPDLVYGPATARRLRADASVRLLFFGRLMAYKGLPLFLDVIEELWSRGIRVEFGVFGEGMVESGTFARIRRMRGEFVNRWLRDDEIGAILARYDIMVLSHLEASQSGVIAAAHGAGMPVVVTPVGGLIEQIEDGASGLIAHRADAVALADAIVRMMAEPDLYEAIARHIVDTRASRSMARFAEDCVSHALYAGRDPA